MEGSEWRLLPAELWTAVFRLLSHYQLGQAGLVCRAWASLALQPGLWASYPLTRRLPRPAPSLGLGPPRLGRLASLRLLGRWHWQEALLSRDTDQITPALQVNTVWVGGLVGGIGSKKSASSNPSTIHIHD